MGVQHQHAKPLQHPCRGGGKAAGSIGIDLLGAGDDVESATRSAALRAIGPITARSLVNGSGGLGGVWPRGGKDEVGLCA